MSFRDKFKSWLVDRILFNLLELIGYVMHQQINSQQLYVLPTPYLCVLYLSEKKATCATYIINWLVFITEMKSVYSAVRTGSYKCSSLQFAFKGLMRLKSKNVIIQFNSIQFNSIQFNSIQFNSIQFSSILYYLCAGATATGPVTDSARI